jgi:hypothetical protein
MHSRFICGLVAVNVWWPSSLWILILVLSATGYGWAFEGDCNDQTIAGVQYTSRRSSLLYYAIEWYTLSQPSLPTQEASLVMQLASPRRATILPTSNETLCYLWKLYPGIPCIHEAGRGEGGGRWKVEDSSVSHKHILRGLVLSRIW